MSVRCDARARATGREKGDADDDFGQVVVEDAPSSSISRRFIALVALTSTTRAAFAAPIPYGLYAPPPSSSSASSGATKTTKMKTTAERYVDTLTDDLANKRYFFTGDLTTEIFADECRFIDPTTNVKGVERYLRAVRARHVAGRRLTCSIVNPVNLTLETPPKDAKTTRNVRNSDPYSCAYTQSCCEVNTRAKTAKSVHDATTAATRVLIHNRIPGTRAGHDARGSCMRFGPARVRFESKRRALICWSVTAPWREPARRRMIKCASRRSCMRARRR